MSAEATSTEPPQSEPRGRFPLADKLLAGLLTVEGLVILSERSGWLDDYPKGWPVLVTIAALACILLGIVFCSLISKRLRSQFRYRLSSLLLATVAIALPFGWLSLQMRESRQQAVAIKAVRDAGGHVIYHGKQRPAQTALTDLLGGDFFAEAEAVEFRRGVDPFDAFAIAHQDLDQVSNYGDLERAAVLQMTKGLTDIKRLMFSTGQQVNINDDDVVRFKAFERLEVLQMGRSQVTDAGLASLAELTTLWSLNVSNTEVGDESVASLSRIANLRGISLRGTNVTDEGLKHLNQNVLLRSLSLERTQISDKGLQYLSQLRSLEHINLRHTNVTGSGMQHLSELCNLEHLMLDVTQVDDEGLAQLGTLGKLKTLLMDGTQVTDAGLRHLHGLSNLELLILPPDRTSPAELNRLREALPKCEINCQKYQQ